MYSLIFNFIFNIGAGKYTSLISYILSFMIIIVVCIVAKVIVKYIMIKVATKVSVNTKHKWDDIFLKNKFFHHLSWIAVPIVLNLFTGSLPDYNLFLDKTADVFSIIIFVMLVGSIINSADEIYRSYEISKVRPIKGLLQVAKVVLYIIGGVIFIAVLIGESPLVLLGGIGAMTAIITLVFKDAILGFVAGIQLTANDMIRIGDWIEMPKFSADGTVIDLSLTTVKVRNFDNTVTAIPAYALVSDSFINWRGMEKSGGRRIKRAIYIDTSSVKICDNEMLEKLGKINLLSGYISSKLSDIKNYNSKQSNNASSPVNSRHLTNLGTYRAYICAYLKQHPNIHNKMTIMVRQLKTEGEGIPLELYAFTNTIKWEEYEAIQADIFDHLYSVINEFGLSAYQRPTGNDFRHILGK